MRKLFHPSSSKLSAWLEGKEDEKIQAHVEGCDHCATTLERISEGITSNQLSEALIEILSPDQELTLRVEEAVQTKLESREVMELVSGLFVSGLETSKILVTEEL